MKFCTRCGNQLTDDAVFCQKCGEKDATAENSIAPNTSQIHNESLIFENDGADAPRLRTSMKIWMTLSFVLAFVFAIGATADISMMAGVCLFGILGLMFLFLAKTPKGPARIFSKAECFKRTNGISKGVFVGISVTLSLCLFSGILHVFDGNTTSGKEDGSKAKTAVSVAVKQEKAADKTEPKIPEEFAAECPIAVSASMYDNIIGFPELKCMIKNKTDKEIAAIQLYFLPRDVYGEEADGIFAQNKLQCDTPIAANGTDTAVWQMIDQSIKSGDLYVYSVYFSDGTEWGDRNASKSKIQAYAMQTQVSY